ncbi:MAG: hypothetical protein PHC97_01540 [Patescibacteria group bacterium]|nr:hypothetical protein [Patescibacteria group bacterium]
MSNFDELKQEILNLEERKLQLEATYINALWACINAATTPLEARWAYEQTKRHYVTDKMQFMARQKCLSLLENYEEPDLGFEFWHWLVQMLPGQDVPEHDYFKAAEKRRRAADECVKRAPSMEKLDDSLYMLSTPEIYWKKFIELAAAAGNARQIRGAVKHAPASLTPLALEAEERIWAQIGEPVPKQLPKL